MIRDRGRIKWQPFLIPEHKARIARLYEAEDDVKQPELDEQFMEQLQGTISDALECESEVLVIFHSNNRFRTVRGRIHRVDPLSREIIIDNAGERIKIQFDRLSNIHIV